MASETTRRPYPCLNPLDLTVEELGPLAIENPALYVLLMYPDVIGEKVTRSLERRNRKRRQMSEEDIDALASEVTLKLLELPLDTIRQMLNLPKTFDYHFIVAYQEITMN
jgi:hypothetical protein